MILPLLNHIFETAGINIVLWPYFQFILLSSSIVFLGKTIESKITKDLSLILISIFSITLLIVDFRNFTSDVLGLSFLFFSTSFSLRLLKEITVKNLFYFTITIFLTWYTRPAFISIVGTLLIFYLFRFIFFREKLKVVIIILLMIAPFLSYLGVRHHYTNHLGIVPFSGFALAAHSGHYLNPEIIKKLEPSNQILAKKILNRYNLIVTKKNTNFDPDVKCFYYKENQHLGFIPTNAKKLSCLNQYGMTAWITTIAHLNEVAGNDITAKNILSMYTYPLPWRHKNLSSLWPKDNIRYDKALSDLGIDILKNHKLDHIKYFIYANYKFLNGLINSFYFLIIIIISLIFSPFIIQIINNINNYHNNSTFIKNFLKCSSLFILFSISTAFITNFIYGPVVHRYIIYSMFPSLPFLVIFVFYALISYNNFVSNLRKKFKFY
jgi:hypothetical protein